MQAIGLCRFSYLGEGGFQVEHDTLSERMAYLYDPARMAVRFATFETMTLPALKAQTDDDFTLVIVVGESLPAPYRARLDAAVSDMPQAVIKTYPPGPHRKVMQEAINSVIQRSTAPSLQFRMDDDDAVARSYIVSLRDAAKDLAPLGSKHRHIAIDFNQGFIARPSPQGLAVAPTQAPYSTAALALMIQANVPVTVMNFAHRKLAQRMPTVTLTGQDMLVRGHNPYNDSRQKPNVQMPDLVPLDATGEAHFKATFNIDATEVAEAFSRLPPDVRDRM